MPRTQINCPNCRQPAVAEIDQLFDVSTDPQAKQRLLSGVANVFQCQSCGYTGQLATPIVYHDPEKELLLTFSPPEMGMKLQDQERILGPLIKRVVDNLPNEKRKAYLFQPQSVLTFQGLIERILEADGITKEMIQAQQGKIQLIQRLMGVDDDVLNEIVKQEEKKMDAEFFGILGRLIEAAAGSGDRESAQNLVSLQQKLVPITEYGREMQQQAEEIQEAAKSLRDLGHDLTQEKLLELLVAAPTETRVEALVSMARPAMDYTFFQLLTEKIDQASGEEQESLKQLRETLLTLTSEIDAQVEQRMAQTKQLIEAIVSQPDIEAAMSQVLQAVDDYFLQVLQQELEAARKNADLDRIAKLQKINTVIEEASTPPAGIQLVQELLELEDDETIKATLNEHRDEINSEFIEMLTTLLSQPQIAENEELSARLQALYGFAARISMENSLKQ